MAKTFTLVLKDGVEVKNIEELRENFDLEKIVEYFKSGELVEWLENMFYDDEAEAISEIDSDDKNLTQKICAALDVECDEDLEFTQRIREKKAILTEKTDDQTIIDNATNTALDQKDLAELLHMDYKKIYLCGELFNVPIRMTDMNYIGILGTPKIKIKANSDEELKSKNIKFENCKLPWTKESPIDTMKSLVKKIFDTNGEWPIIDNSFNVVSSYDKLDKMEKIMAVNLCCGKKYKESDIIFMMLKKDLSDGFVFTVDSFCTNEGEEIIKYNKINYVDLNLNNNSELMIFDNERDENNFKYFGHYEDDIFHNNKILNEKVKKFLDIAKNL